MTSKPPREHRSVRVLRYALILSALLHALLLPLILWAVALRLPMLREQTPREDEVASTAITLERRPIPRPRSVSQQPSTQAQQEPKTQTQSATPTPVQRPQATPQPHELSHEAPNAPPQPTTPPSSAPDAQTKLQRELDAQQQQYAHTVAQLNAANNVHSIATLPPATPAARHVSSFDESGMRDRFLAGHGLLEPIKSWEPDPQHTCYYVSYSFEYANGASEDGNVPWPICYPKTADEFKKPPHPMDLPTPQPGFTTSKFLTPLLKYYYNRKQGPPPQ